MSTKLFHSVLARAIQDGIDKFQTAIKKNDAKEKAGLAKLEKTLGGQDPALTGAGGNLSAGSAMTEVPNLARAEKKEVKIPRSKTKTLDRMLGKAGVLPEGGGPGVPGGVGDMNSNMDAGFGASEKSMTKGQIPSVKGIKPGSYALARENAERASTKALNGSDKYGHAAAWLAHGVAAVEAKKAGLGNEARQHEAKQLEHRAKVPTPLMNSEDKKTAKLPDGSGFFVGTVGKSEAMAKSYGDESSYSDESVPVGNGPTNCNQCGGNLNLLGVLGNRIHLVCQGCGMHSSFTPQEENTEAKENPDPTVTKAEPIATIRTNKPKGGISSLPAPQSKMVVKGELAKVAPPGEEKLVHKLKDEYGHDEAGKKKAFATAWAIKNKTVKKGELAKEEINPRKEVPLTATVVAEKVKGAKDGTEKIPEAIKTDSSGDITKGKGLEKGAMVEHIKAKSKAAGLDPKEVMRVKLPKTLPTQKPASTPSFNKAAILPGQKGFQREVEKKTGILSSDKGGAHPSMVNTFLPGHSRHIPKIKGGVQSQIAAVKKPLIPMVNTAGVVAKGEKRPGESNYYSKKHSSDLPEFTYARKPEDKDKAKKNNKIAESKAQEVEKAEPTMAKPVTKSPSSAPAGKTSPQPPKPVTPKVSKL